MDSNILKCVLGLRATPVSFRSPCKFAGAILGFGVKPLAGYRPWGLVKYFSRGFIEASRGKIFFENQKILFT